MANSSMLVLPSRTAPGPARRRATVASSAARSLPGSSSRQVVRMPRVQSTSLRRSAGRAAAPGSPEAGAHRRVAPARRPSRGVTVSRARTVPCRGPRCGPDGRARPRVPTPRGARAGVAARGSSVLSACSRAGALPDWHRGAEVVSRVRTVASVRSAASATPEPAGRGTGDRAWPGGVLEHLLDRPGRPRAGRLAHHVAAAG